MVQAGSRENKAQVGREDKAGYREQLFPMHCTKQMCTQQHRKWRGSEADRNEQAAGCSRTPTSRETEGRRRHLGRVGKHNGAGNVAPPAEQEK
jgi:hypothetical protein